MVEFFLFLVDNTEGSLQNLKKCIAEVTNTPWGERVSFLFNPNSDVVAKSLHVSPFMDMLGNWTMKTISVNHPKHGEYFSASLMAKRVSSSTHTDLDLFFWLMPHKIALGIYWQALKLWWKGVPFLQHPRHRTINRLESTVPILQITQLQDIMASLGGMQNGPGAKKNAMSSSAFRKEMALLTRKLRKESLEQSRAERSILTIKAALGMMNKVGVASVVENI
ncbi:hypothetical protein KY285_024468 [Solanum tuberosum]|nr:hypothetical protein KY285_024468 [Solanum tuberosum]